MVLDLVSRDFEHGGTLAITRFFVDMPVVAGKICMIRQVHVLLVDFARLNAYDISYGMSLDPDDPGDSLIGADSRMFISGRYSKFQLTAVGFQVLVNNPIQYHFPEGLKCPYGRLPFFIQHSNANVATTFYRVTVFYDLVKLSPQELAVAVMRRGRGETRRVP